jgi:hypothetical protein
MKKSSGTLEACLQPSTNMGTMFLLEAMASAVAGLGSFGGHINNETETEEEAS